MLDAERNEWWPEDARNVLAAGDERDRRAAATIKPATDVDDERHIGGPSSQQADEDAVPDEEFPCSSLGCYRQPRANHDRTEERGATNPKAFGNPAKCQSARTRAKPCQCVGQCRDGA
jgi:hypothetical protein